MCACLAVACGPRGSAGEDRVSNEPYDDAVINLFAGSDRHGNVGNLDTLVKQASAIRKLDAALLDGDNVGHHGKDAPEYSLSDITTDIRTSARDGDLPVYYVYGSHDAKAVVDNENRFLVGPADLKSAYLYGIDFDEMTREQEARSAAEAFTRWASTLEEGDKRPIIVVSHAPLHKRRGDNVGGSVWLTAINAAAERHDIVFLWAHNHTKETSEDTALYYAEPGCEMTAEGNDAAQPINFTYMNAGYIKEGYSTLLSIGKESIEARRFSLTGLAESHVIALTQGHRCA